MSLSEEWWSHLSPEQRKAAVNSARYMRIAGRVNKRYTKAVNDQNWDVSDKLGNLHLRLFQKAQARFKNTGAPYLHVHNKRFPAGIVIQDAFKKLHQARRKANAARVFQRAANIAKGRANTRPLSVVPVVRNGKVNVMIYPPGKEFLNVISKY